MAPPSSCVLASDAEGLGDPPTAPAGWSTRRFWPSGGHSPASYTVTVSRSLVERRLGQVSERLKRLHEELVIADEQLRHFTEEADDSRLRALVSETPLAEREHREAQRHADAMRHHRAELVAGIAKLERSLDDLLDRLVTERT